MRAAIQYATIGFFAFLCVCVGFVGCQPTPSGEHNHDGGHHQVTPDTSSSRPNKDYKKIQMTSDDSCEVEFKFGSDEEWPPKGDHFNIIVTVKTKDGSVDKDFAIEVDADMPEHGHGMNSVAKVATMENTKNQFKVDGMLFHMRGWWEIYVKVTKGCGAGSKATFNTFVE